MAIGRISGPMLQTNLERQGVDLSIETNLLYIDVTNDRIGVLTDTPTVALDVNGDIRADNLSLSGSLTIGDGSIDTLDTGNIRLADNTISTTDTDGNLVLSPNGGGLVVISDTDGGAMGIEMSTPTQGSLTSNAATLTAGTTVTNGIALLNVVLGKLVPPAPPNFPNGASLTVSYSSVSAKMCDGFTQTDNTASGSKAVAPGTTVSVARSSSYTTNTISNTGPGDSGTITAYLNGVDEGSVSFNTNIDPVADGTYNDLIVSSNRDYNAADSSVAANFWYIFNASAAGTVTEGWNEVQLTHSTAGSTNTPYWYYDSVSVSAPQFTNVSMTAPESPVLAYSSSIPHYTTSNSFVLAFDVNRLSGNTYPNNGNLLTNSRSSGGAFNAPASVGYPTAGITVPLEQNLYVSSGSASATTTAGIKSGFGSSSSGPSVTVSNSYTSATQSFTPGATVLFKTGTATDIDETDITIGSTIGSGSGNAYRIENPGTGNTPAFTANATTFNSQSSTLQTYDAVVVGSGSQGVLKHDQTNYSTGYLPAGPNLSVGRTGTQYFTMKFVRTATSKFDIKFSGRIAGMWVALPGSTIDSTSSINGWLDMSTAYAGAGVPGANTGAGGNGSNGCSLGGTVTLNSDVTNHRRTCTFGTVSSSSTETNEIYVRIALLSGRSVTALTLETASN